MVMLDLPQICGNLKSKLKLDNWIVGYIWVKSLNSFDYAFSL